MAIWFSSAVGTRKNEQMQPIVEGLSNEDVRNLGAYFASLPRRKTRSRMISPICPTRERSLQRAAAAPHATPIRRGHKATARVAGQREEYLLKALHDYKTGVRAAVACAAMADVAFRPARRKSPRSPHYLAHL